MSQAMRVIRHPITLDAEQFITFADTGDTWDKTKCAFFFINSAQGDDEVDLFDFAGAPNIHTVITQGMASFEFNPDVATMYSMSSYIRTSQQQQGHHQNGEIAAWYFLANGTSQKDWAFTVEQLPGQLKLTFSNLPTKLFFMTVVVFNADVVTKSKISTFEMVQDQINHVVTDVGFNASLLVNMSRMGQNHELGLDDYGHPLSFGFIKNDLSAVGFSLDNAWGTRPQAGGIHISNDGWIINKYQQSQKSFRARVSAIDPQGFTITQQEFQPFSTNTDRFYAFMSMSIVGSVYWDIADYDIPAGAPSQVVIDGLNVAPKVGFGLQSLLETRNVRGVRRDFSFYGFDDADTLNEYSVNNSGKDIDVDTLPVVENRIDTSLYVWRWDTYFGSSNDYLALGGTILSLDSDGLTFDITDFDALASGQWGVDSHAGFLFLMGDEGVPNPPDGPTNPDGPTDPVNVAPLPVVALGGNIGPTEDGTGDEDWERLVRDEYYPILNDMLEKYDWTFATRSEAIALDAGLPPISSNWVHRYRIPDDVLRILTVNNNKVNGGRWTREGKWIFSNEGYCNLRSIVETDESEFSPMFFTAFMTRLQSEWAIPMAASRKMRNAFKEDWVEMLENAAMMDGHVGTPDNVGQGRFIDVRSRGHRNDVGPIL